MADAAKDTWVQRILGVSFAPPGPSAAELTRRLMAVRDRLIGANILAAFADQLRSAAAAVKTEPAEALPLIVALEGAVDRAPQADAKPPMAEAMTQVPEEDPPELPGDAPATLPREVVVSQTKLRQQLKAAEAAVEAAAASLEAACRAMLQTPAFEDDPSTELPVVDAAIAAIGSRVPDFSATAAALAGSLARLATASDAKDRTRLTDSALGAIATYRRALDDESLLEELESSEAGSFPIRTPIDKALDGLAKGLQG